MEVLPSFCSIGTILPFRPAHNQCRRAQRGSRMARLRATASAARSVLDGREHGGTLGRVGEPIRTNPTIKKRARKAIKNRDHAQYLHSHLLWLRLSYSSIVKLLSFACRLPTG